MEFSSEYFWVPIIVYESILSCMRPSCGACGWSRDCCKYAEWMDELTARCLKRLNLLPFSLSSFYLLFFQLVLRQFRDSSSGLTSY